MNDDIGSPAIANDRPKRKREHRGRRNYRKELADLENRVKVALRLLCDKLPEEKDRELPLEYLVAVAVEILKGD